MEGSYGSRLTLTPQFSYSMPDAKQDREGPQTGDATTASVKSTPRDASRSMFGVGTGTSGLRPSQS